MEQTLHPPETYDFRKYDRIWQRVAPDLEPYPDLRQTAGPAVPAAEPSQGAAMAMEVLPGAEPDPCCMGTAAQEELGVLGGFIEVELSDRRAYQALMRQAPAFARGTLKDLAAAAGTAVKRLTAACYLITGTCPGPSVPGGDAGGGRNWCQALRERYHAEACNAMNYLRAGEETADPCLRRLLTELGEGAYRRADRLMALLERSL